jgi:hypothetical protein
MELIWTKEVVKGICASLVVLLIMAIGFEIMASFDIISAFITFGYIVPYRGIIEVRFIMGIVEHIVL